MSLSKVDSHCGITRPSEADAKIKGIRFSKADYLQAFAILKPDERLPQIVLANHHVKVAPKPLGSTHEQVQTWLTAQQWEARPLKPLSVCSVEWKSGPGKVVGGQERLLSNHIGW